MMFAPLEGWRHILLGERRRGATSRTTAKGRGTVFRRNEPRRTGGGERRRRPVEGDARGSGATRSACRDEVSLPGEWSARLFVGLCRRYGVRPGAPLPLFPPTPYDDRGESAAALLRCGGWRQFSDLHTDLWIYFVQTTEPLIKEAIHTDTRRPTRTC
jgi:hypothetical protein